MKIIAVDPGYDRAGFAILEHLGAKDTLIYSECLQTSKSETIYSRIQKVGKETSRLIKKYKPDAIAIESLFFSKNVKTALRIAEMRGVILFLAADRGLEVAEFTPNQVKSAVCGNGQASKKDIEFSLNRFFGIETAGKLDDELDAIAVGLTYFAFNRKI